MSGSMIDWNLVSIIIDFLFVIGIFYAVVQFDKMRVARTPRVSPLSKQSPLWIRAVNVCFLALLGLLLVFDFLFFIGRIGFSDWLLTAISGVSMSWFLFIIYSQSRLRKAKVQETLENR
jgi:hypothetical protein